MHGQYDWTGDPALDGARYEWDIACTGTDWPLAQLRAHTFTNVLGRDRDVGYGFLRVSRAALAPRPPRAAVGAALLALLFQWGVGMHDLHLDDTLAGRQSLAELRRRGAPFARKAAWQLAKDYVVLPALASATRRRARGKSPGERRAQRWTFAVIFCGHFPAGVEVFREADTRDERRGDWYLRQLRGSANIEGGRAFHVMTATLAIRSSTTCFRPPRGALPRARAARPRDLRALRPTVLTGSFATQLGSVAAQLARNALRSPTHGQYAALRRVAHDRDGPSKLGSFDRPNSQPQWRSRSSPVSTSRRTARPRARRARRSRSTPRAHAGHGRDPAHVPSRRAA